MTITAGTIVLPQGDPVERIVGIVLPGANTQYPLVLWLSDQRGAFTCEEATSDLTVATLNERGDMNDERIDHVRLATTVMAVVLYERIEGKS